MADSKLRTVNYDLRTVNSELNNHRRVNVPAFSKSIDAIFGSRSTPWPSR